MFYTYILESQKTKRYYVGCTNDIKRRLLEHNNGISKYTRLYAPWMIKYSEIFDTLKKARHREKEIKNWKSREKIETLINTNRSYRLEA